MNFKVNLKKDTNYSYSIYFDRIETLTGFVKKINPTKCIIITDYHVENLYSGKLANVLKDFKTSIISFKPGEGNKNIQTYEGVIKQLISIGADRKSLILALGGGVVGDVAGFVAGTYLRGIPFIQIPTTLLAIVDSSIGGKVGVDLKECKNACGLFYQPTAVFADFEFLKTLSKEEIKNGLVEMIKYGVIKDSDFFEFLEKNIDKALQLDKETLLECIKCSCEIKAEIVAQDEKEKSLRMILNLGHTVGHAIEILNNYHLKHGECVAEGIIKEAEIANKMDILDGDDLDKIKRVIRKLGLAKPNYDSRIIEIMKSDKKNAGGKIKFALPKKIGEVFVTDKVPLDVIEGVL